MYNWEVTTRKGQTIQQTVQVHGLSEEQRNETKIFRWIDYDNGHKVEVDMDTGIFKVGDQIFHASMWDMAVLSNRPDIKYKLIYATRHFIHHDSSEEIMFLLGWQFTKDNKNIKRILYIHPNKEIVFGGEGEM